MKIALAALSCDRVTGIGRIVSSLADEYQEAGHSVTVIAQFIEGVPAGVHTVRRWRPPLSGAAQKIMFAQQTESIFARSRFDLTHAFGVGRGAQIVSAQSCHRAGVEAKALLRRGRITGGGIGLFDAVSLRDERVLMADPRTLGVIAVSQLVRNELVRFYGISDERIRVIPNGVARLQEQLPRGRRERLRSDAGAGNHDYLLLFVGNEFDRKGLQTVIEAISILADPNVRLLVVGDDDRTPYERFAGRLGVAGRLHFAGRTGAVEELFGAADAFVLPTLYEPFGMVIVEAMAAGLPVIASARAGAVEGLKHDIHGLYIDDPLSAEELANLVRRLMNDAELHDRLAASGRSAATRFLWKSIAEETLSVYAEFAGRTRGHDR